MNKSQPLLHPPKILVVEDERITAQHIRRVLSKLGYDIAGCSANGEDALSLTAQTRPDLLLIDIGLEGEVDGVAVAALVRDRFSIPVVFLTAYTDPHTIARARVTEPYGYLVKPFGEQELHATIEIALQQRVVAERQNQQIQSDAQVIKQTRDELAFLAARLLTAQEDERQRIARDLHDDMVQRLALVQMELEGLRLRASGECSESTSSAFLPIISQIEDLTAGLRDLSHQLHPSVLDDLGLVAALRQMAREFQRRELIRTRVAVRSIPANLLRPIAVTLYRIVQEALRNIGKHAEASSVSIALIASADAVHLTVRDTGKGFNYEVSRQKGTLGIVSMSQRAELVGGTLDVRSEAGNGTQIHVQIPLIRQAEGDPATLPAA